MCNIIIQSKHYLNPYFKNFQSFYNIIDRLYQKELIGIDFKKPQKKIVSKKINSVNNNSTMLLNATKGLNTNTNIYSNVSFSSDVASIE